MMGGCAGKGPELQVRPRLPQSLVEQQYLPDVLKNTKYYTFGENKNEQASRAYWARIKGEENV